MSENEIPVKVSDEALRGVYANQMVVRHTREEFVLDFLSVFPPGGVVNARVIVSPAHCKRMIRALHENVARFEAAFGPILEAEGPSPGAIRN